MAFLKGISGNPSGRPLGALQVRSKAALAIFEKHDFDSLEESVKLAKSFTGTIVGTKDFEMKTEYRKMLLLLLQTLIKYQYPQLKQVELLGEIDVTHRFEHLEQLPDSALTEAVELLREERSSANGQHA